MMARVAIYSTHNLYNMIYLGWLLIFIGIFFILSGLIGVLRFTDFFTKLHPTTIVECVGVPICLVGLSLMQNTYSTSFKLILMAMLIFILNPISTYALARSSLKEKIDHEGRIK